MEIQWTLDSIEQGNLVDTILTNNDKAIALSIIQALRKANMMGDALGVISRRFGLSTDAIASWYYTKHYKPQH